MEEMEVPIEGLQDTILERAKEEKEWNMYVAISTAFMAVFAAISGMLAGHYSNEALIQQIKASDQWSYYQAKGIKGEVASLNPTKDSTSVLKYKKEQKTIKKTAEDFEKKSETLLEEHIVLARSVTLFQIAIAISAISILTRKKILWYSAILLALVGVGFFISNFI
ncbi:MAG: hypothetical protein NVSMB45_00370 [Ginsengibacter sp.]